MVNNNKEKSLDLGELNDNQKKVAEKYGIIEQ